MRYIKWSLLAILFVATTTKTKSQGFTFSKHVLSSNYTQSRSADVADVNGDGHMDVVAVASSIHKRIAWWENDGNENFTEHVITDTLNSLWSVKAVDLDEDGDIDIVSCSRTEDIVLWWENDGNENFTQVTIADNYNGPEAIHLVDLDKDDDLDLIIPGSIGDTLVWWENDGDPEPSFTAHPIPATVDFPTSVATADMDGDNDLDILLTDWDNEEVLWFENDGSPIPNFTERVIGTDFPSCFSVQAAMINNDTLWDVVAASAGDDKVLWWENLGGGNFLEHELVTDFNSAAICIPTDLNLDGKTDMIIGGGGSSDKVVWYPGDGFGNWAPEQPIGDDLNSPSSVTVADIDGNGAPDVLTTVAGSGTNDLVWWESNFVVCPEELNSLEITPNGPTTFCDGDSVALVVLTAYDSYQWLENGVPNGEDTQVLWVYGSGDYSVVADSLGCIDTSMTTTTTELDEFAGISPMGAITICEDDELELTSDSADHYVWLKDGMVIEGDTMRTAVVDSMGMYQVVAILSGCVDTSAILILSLDTVPDAPAIIPISFDSLQCVQEGTGYQWFFNGTQMPDTTQSIEVIGEGQYKCVLENGECESDTAVFDYAISALANSRIEKEKLLVYPNPFSHSFSIENLNTFPAEISLISATGQLVWRSTIAAQQPNGTGIQIALPEIQRGVYLLTVETRGEVQRKRLLAQ